MAKTPKFRPCPTVNTGRVSNTYSFDVDTTPREDIIKILLNYQGAWFEASYDGDVFLMYDEEETMEQRDERVLNEQRAIEQWHKEYAEWLENNERIREEKTKKAEEERRSRAEKYKNPEFIEFLRLQAKMKEQGLI